MKVVVWIVLREILGNMRSPIEEGECKAQSVNGICGVALSFLFKEKGQSFDEVVCYAATVISHHCLRTIQRCEVARLDLAHSLGIRAYWPFSFTRGIRRLKVRLHLTGLSL